MEQGQIERLEKGLDKLRAMTSWANQQAAAIVENIDAIYWKTPDKKKFAQIYCQLGGPELMISNLAQLEKDGLFKVKYAWETAFVIYNSVCNVSETSAEVSTVLGEKGMVRLCAQNIEKYRAKVHLKDIETLMRMSLGILCNLSTTPANRHVFREEGVEERMQPYLQGEGDPFLKTLCMITLAYIVEEGQEEGLAAKGGETTEYLVKILKDARKSPDKRYKGLCDIEIVQALGRLAVHDQNKKKIMDAGGIPVLVKMLEDRSTDTQEAAANILWNMAFCEEVRRALEVDQQCLAAIHKLCSSPASNVVDAANGALWVITKKTAKDRENEKAEQSKEDSHIMISYQWGSQSMVLKVRDFLKAAGYRVWVDVDHMSGSTLQAMAEAVERAGVVLVCISERYKESPNCRTEAEYAFQLRKPIVPVMMEEYYQPDGWLGIILGAKLYMDLSGRLDIDEEMGKLRKEVESHGAPAGGSRGTGDHPNGSSDAKSVQRNISSEPTQHKTHCWTNDQVKDWLAKHDLQKWRPGLMRFDGQGLHRLAQLRREAPEFFYASIQSDESIAKLEDVFKFTAALDALMNE